jgi:hypothetical protein
MGFEGFHRAHKICFTAHLQKSGLSDLSSVTVKKLNPPALKISLSARGRDEPSRGSGVGPGEGLIGAEQDAEAAPALGGELDAASLHAREARRRRNARGDSGGAQAFGDGPEFVGGAENQEAIERNPHRAEGGREKLAGAVAPDDPAELGGGAS